MKPATGPGGVEVARDRRRIVGRLAAFFFLGSGVLAELTALLPAPPGVNRPASIAVASVALLAGVAAWLAPWERWPSWASLAVVPVALALIGTGNVVGGSDPYTFGMFFVVVFVWVGIAHPLGTSLWLAPLAAVAYVIPILELPGDPGPGLRSAALAIPVSVLIGETLAWVTGRLRSTADELRRKSDLLEVLEEVAVAANEAPSVERAVETCLELVCRHTGWPLGHAFLLDDGPAGGLAPSAIWFVRPGRERQFETFCRVTEATRVGPGVGMPAAVLATGEPAWATDLALDRSFLNGELAAELGVRASFAFPVMIGREVVGVLEFFADRPAELDEQLLEVMTHVGTQLGRVVERRRAAEAIRAEEIAHRALHDSLTGLPNMTLFEDRLNSALARLRRNPGQVAVLFLDLDRFKEVNDTFGHATANDLLIETVRRLEGVVRPSDTVARFGGDEFVVLCEDLHEKDEALAIARRVVEALSEPFLLGLEEVKLSASVGLALATKATDDPSELVANADRAMYRAKRRGRARFEVYDERMRAQVRGRHRVESALRLALERDELTLHFQPIVRLADGATVGAEALARWRHPERGVLAASHFMSVAEETGLVTAIDTWALQEACRVLGEWLPEHVEEPFVMSVNISARMFARPELAGLVRSCVRDAGIPASALCLEVAEHALIENPMPGIAAMHALKETGVQLAIDDFGPGYASLGFVKRLPVDVVKLDGAIVAALGTSEEDTAIASAVVTMAEGLGLRTVAENVETEEQLACLRGVGCQWGQGTLWSRPLTPPAFLRSLRSRLPIGA